VGLWVARVSVCVCDVLLCVLPCVAGTINCNVQTSCQQSDFVQGANGTLALTCTGNDACEVGSGLEGAREGSCSTWVGEGVCTTR
jgi:hypothetical protein